MFVKLMINHQYLLLIIRGTFYKNSLKTLLSPLRFDLQIQLNIDKKKQQKKLTQ